MQSNCFKTIYSQTPSLYICTKIRMMPEETLTKTSNAKQAKCVCVQCYENNYFIICFDKNHEINLNYLNHEMKTQPTPQYLWLPFTFSFSLVFSHILLQNFATNFCWPILFKHQKQEVKVSWLCCLY